MFKYLLSLIYLLKLFILIPSLGLCTFQLLFSQHNIQKIIFLLASCLLAFICEIDPHSSLFCLFQFQKQFFADVLRNMCSKKFCKFYREATVLESLFNKVAGNFFSNFTGKHPCCILFLIKFQA